MNADMVVMNASKEIQAINMRYLTLIQKIAQVDIPRATVMFGADENVCRVIAGLTTDQIEFMSASNVLFFKAKIDADILAMVSSTPIDISTLSILIEARSFDRHWHAMSPLRRM